MSKVKSYITIGVDYSGQLYGLELEDGKWRRNPLGYTTSCAVLRPVSKMTLRHMRQDPAEYIDTWKQAVADDATTLGLQEWFDRMLVEDGGSVFGEDEGFPFKDESFCWELLMDEENPTVKGHPNFREEVEKAILANPDIDRESTIGTWECGGWFPPEEPFVIELAPKEIIEEYYEHIRKTGGSFKREMEAIEEIEETTKNEQS